MVLSQDWKVVGSVFRRDPRIDLHTFNVADLEDLEKFENVSFDFFDTLFYRSTVTHFRGWMEVSVPYAFNRALAEIIARIVSRMRGRLEVRTNEIYRYILRRWTPQHEILNESKILQPNIYLRDLHNRLVKIGVNVFIVSDTHFSQSEIADWMRKYDFAAVPIYTSQEFLKTKSTGLFQNILSLRGVEPQNWVHIGDNLKSDISAARDLGMHAIYYPNLILQLNSIGVLSTRGTSALLQNQLEGRKVLDALRGQYLLNQWILRLDQKVVASAIANLIVAPIASTLAHETRAIAMRTKSELVLYSSRDGWLPFLWHSKMYPEDAIRYFNTSRAMLKDPFYLRYVDSQTKNAKIVCVYDLGWRGSTISFLRRNLPAKTWIGAFGYLAGAKPANTFAILSGSRHKMLAIWRSRDFVEVLFPDGTPGYASLTSEMKPVQRDERNENVFDSEILDAYGKVIPGDLFKLSPKEASLLIYLTCRYPAPSLIKSMRDSLHDVQDGDYEPLVTDQWKKLFSKNRIMWPYAAQLNDAPTWTLKTIFRIVVNLKDFYQRIHNIFGRLKSFITND
jgi:HAD superfamily hydrolase (TIGR01549 family)